MKQALLILAAGISMLLLIASLVMWPRSHFAMDRVFHDGGQTQTTLTSLDGRVQYFRRTGFPRGESNWYFHTHTNAGPWMIDTVPGRSWYPRLGFSFTYSPIRGGPAGATDLIIMVPYWFLALLSAVLPAIVIIRHVQRRRSLPGHCKHCGYDLRASTDRCPECGKPFVEET